MQHSSGMVLLHSQLFGLKGNDVSTLTSHRDRTCLISGDKRNAEPNVRHCYGQALAYHQKHDLFISLLYPERDVYNMLKNISSLLLVIIGKNQL